MQYEVEKRDGEKTAMNKPRLISLRLETRLYETINTLANKERRTFSNAMHMLLELGLERHRELQKQEKKQ